MPPVPGPPRFEEQPIPAWQKLAAVGVLASIIVAVGLWHDRLRSDFWPPDESRIAPNVVASIIQAAVVLAVAAVLWPPTRRRIHRFVTSHTDPLHAHFAAIHGRHDELLRRHEELRDVHAALLASQDALHAKIDEVRARPARTNPSQTLSSKPKPKTSRTRKEPPA